MKLIKKSAIDTLEVKDIDLNKEYKNFVEDDPVYSKLVNNIVGKSIAKHFFELGLKAKKEEMEHPEYGYIQNDYVLGKKPRYNVGDVLAYYECNSNEEGERIIGKIANIELDNEEDWVYTFEDGSTLDEQGLIEEGIYKKI